MRLYLPGRACLFKGEALKYRQSGAEEFISVKKIAEFRYAEQILMMVTLSAAE